MGRIRTASFMDTNMLGVAYHKLYCT